MVMKFEFVNQLPKRTGGRAPDPVLIEFAEALRKKPNVWAKYPRELSPTSRAQLAGQINKGFGPVSMHGEPFEAASRDGVLYVRYIKERK